MRSKKEIHKTKAFTLAEMLVIFAVVSVIMAATMPIMSMKKGIIGDSAADSASDNYWVSNDTFDAIGTPYNVNMGYATAASQNGSKLNIKLRGDMLDSAQISLLKKTSLTSSVYNGSRIALTGKAIAVGNNAFVFGSSTFTLANTYSNIALGTYAGSDYTGSASTVTKDTYARNVAIGSYALTNYITGSSLKTTMFHSVAIGTFAFGKTSANNYGNIAIGTYASSINSGSSLVSKMYSTAIGRYADYNSIYSSVCAVWIGAYAGANRTAASSSFYTTAIGESAFNGAQGIYNTAIGYYALKSGSATQSTIIGAYAGQSSTATNGVLIGLHPIDKGTKTTTNTVAIGKGYTDTIGGTFSNSVIIGHSAHRNPASGLSTNGSVIIDSKGVLTKTAVAASTNTTNSVSVQMGASKFAAVNNVLLGKQDAFYSNTICIGDYACSAYSAQGSINIGYYANKGFSGASNKASFIFNNIKGVSLASTNDATAETGKPITYKKAFGFDSTYSVLSIIPTVSTAPSRTAVPTDGMIVLYAKTVYGPTSTFSLISDKRLKTNIKPAKESINEIRKINIYEYNMKDDELKIRKIGVIAQELKDILPNSVKVNKYTGYYTVNADWIIHSMVNSVKYLDSHVNKLKEEITLYIRGYKILVQRLDILENEIKQLEKENKVLAHEINTAYKKAKTLEKQSR